MVRTDVDVAGYGGPVRSRPLRCGPPRGAGEGDVVARRRPARLAAVSVGAACMVTGTLIIFPGLRHALDMVVPIADDLYFLADKYAGVLALLALTGAVVAGRVAALRGPVHPRRGRRRRRGPRAA